MSRQSPPNARKGDPKKKEKGTRTLLSSYRIKSIKIFTIGLHSLFSLAARPRTVQEEPDSDGTRTRKRKLRNWCAANFMTYKLSCNGEWNWWAARVLICQNDEGHRVWEGLWMLPGKVISERLHEAEHLINCIPRLSWWKFLGCGNSPFVSLTVDRLESWEFITVRGRKQLPTQGRMQSSWASWSFLWNISTWMVFELDTGHVIRKQQ